MRGSEKRSGAGSTAGPEELDSADFSMERYIDRLFPDGAALEGVGLAEANARHQLLAVSGEIRRALRVQSDSSQQQAQGIEATKAAITELYTRISEMKAKARSAERVVVDITQDIRSLDFAKRNLTQTTTTMRRLQLLVGSVAQLRQLKEQGRYHDAAQLLPAIGGLREGFSDFQPVRQIAKLDQTAESLRRSLASQALQEVQRGFDAQGLLVGNAKLLRDACLCCEPDRVVDHYCGLQLRAYTVIFQLSDDVSQLENISRRYAWLRRIMRNYADEHADLFPARWRMGEQLSRRFAVATRDHLGEIMATRDHLNVDHLTTALADTLAFEAQCDKKFGIAPRARSDPVPAPSPSSSSPASSPLRGESQTHVYEDSGEPAESFIGAISCAFEPYMSIFVDGERAKFERMVLSFQREPIAADDDPSLSVLASSTDLLYQFRESLRQCASLSTGQAMADLAQVFAQSLGGYARNVLVHKLPRITSATTAPLDDIKHACLIINTADYCASAASQLEQKIVERVDAEFKSRVSFSVCREALLNSINAGIRALVAGVEAMCASAFAALAQEPWHDVQMVGDQSGYVLLVASALAAATETVRRGVSGPRYFRSYCDKFAARFAEAYTAAIAQCGRISEVGAEQLLLDAQALKSVLLGMPAIGAEESPPPPPPPAFARIVGQSIGRIEALLKAILVPSEPADALVDRFLLLFPEAPRDVFRQVLNLKGVRAAEHTAYVRILQRAQRGASDASVTPATTVPAHAAHVSSSVPPETHRAATRSAGHARDASSASAAAAPARGGGSPVAWPSDPRPDPLGITGAAQPCAAQPGTDDAGGGQTAGGGGGGDGDAANSPVLASLAANATATRTRINENLRRFVSNMRRG
ncbi:Vacuolar protein sorting-associated protein 53 [Coemansia biformis]|uniref:Vacuolar protein sorting-associated protein 53 n=1 Tax=Coemansia biformis TaxID=1286918 RepID=A0A9W7YAA9_9FUNG|nr:Vacuolar protein sorting-associated protein 53 [Coemansia biformis]